MSVSKFTAILLAATLALPLAAAGHDTDCFPPAPYPRVCPYLEQDGAAMDAYVYWALPLFVAGGFGNYTIEEDPADPSARVATCFAAGLIVVVHRVEGCADSANPPAVPTDPQVWIDWARATAYEVLEFLPCQPSNLPHCPLPF